MKKCKNCKKPFEQVHFLQKFCFEDECKKVWIESEKEKEWKKRKSEMKAKSQTRTELLKLAQITFNKWIRERDKNEPCISCGAKAGTYTLSAGHFYPSTNKNVTFNEDNVHGQCWYNCNSNKSGNLLEYRVGLIKKIGIERLEKLEQESRKDKKWTIEEIKEIILIYKERLKHSK